MGDTSRKGGKQQIKGKHCQQRCHSKLFKLPNVRSVASLSMPMRRGLLVVKNGTWVALLAQSAIRCWTAPTCRKRMGFCIARLATPESLVQKATDTVLERALWLTLDPK